MADSPLQPQPHSSRPYGDHLDDAIAQGAAVEVHHRFDDRWSGGFEIAAVDPEGYRLRRRSDGSVLPVLFSPSEVRPLRNNSAHRR